MNNKYSTILLILIILFYFNIINIELFKKKPILLIFLIINIIVIINNKNIGYILLLLLIFNILNIKKNMKGGGFLKSTITSILPITGAFDYSKHGQGGTTRIVGIYEDPLVKAGIVEKDSVFDGSRTFINDLKLDNLILKTVGDYDGDGFQPIRGPIQPAA